MEERIPRVLLAGTNSGCGKTTVTCGILQALKNRKIPTGAFKCGPDYIDPMFHSRIIGTESRNLDPYFYDADTLRYLLAENGRAWDFSLIEGVMGYYDGLSMTVPRASTYDLARMTDSPAVLVVNARGLSLSVLAIIEGFFRLFPDSHIRGVILNQCSPMTYPSLKAAVLEHFGGQLLPLGYLPPMPQCALESRHLGLVTAQEVEDLREKMQILGDQAEKSLDIDGILALGQEAPPVKCTPPVLPRHEKKVRIAVARDKAFCFYYADNLQALTRMGAELVEYSPLKDPALPENIQGLYLGGGYPELYARALSENTSMLASVRQALQRKLPCIAECGGFMYLTGAIGKWPMVGFLPGESFDTGKLCRFGYVELEAKQDNMLCSAGEKIRGHEFHHWDCTDPGRDFTARKPSGRSWDCVFAGENLYAGYPHFHFYGNPRFAEGFYEACEKEL